jgi:arylsulfatase A-like enzyme
MTAFKATISVTATLAILAAAGCAAERDSGCLRPNVLLISIDTLRPDHLGCYGYDRETAPNLESLAARSVRFANAFSTSSWTLPAHASMLTGLYPAEHGVQTDISALPPSAPTLQEALGEHGYETFAATSHVYLGARWGFDRGWDHFDGSAGQNSAHRPVAEAIINSGLRWLDERTDPERPFFIWLHIFDPHWDYSPPAPFDTSFDPEYDGEMTGDYESLRPFIKALATAPQPELSRRDLEHLLALYDGEIHYADRELERFLEALRERGIFDSTLIAVTSDHGEEFMEHGSLEGHQWTLHDEVVRVPLLLKYPCDRDAGLVIDDPVSIVGLPGAILKALGLDSEWRGLATPHPILLDLTVRREERQLGLQEDGFKLLRYADGREALYADRAEIEDLADLHPDSVARMSSRLDELLDGMARLPDAGAERLPLDALTLEQLRSLGYVR